MHILSVFRNPYKNPILLVFIVENILKWGIPILVFLWLLKKVIRSFGKKSKISVKNVKID